MPILGVCLGHQSIGAAFGGNIVKAPEIFHGKTSKINHDGSLLFSNIENSYEVVRYHSLIIDTNTLPEQLKVCLLYTSPSPRDLSTSRMPSSA